MYLVQIYTVVKLGYSNVGGGTLFPPLFCFPPFPSSLNPARGLGSTISFPSGDWGEASAEAESGVFKH